MIDVLTPLPPARTRVNGIILMVCGLVALAFGTLAFVQIVLGRMVPWIEWLVAGLLLSFIAMGVIMVLMGLACLRDPIDPDARPTMRRTKDARKWAWIQASLTMGWLFVLIMVLAASFLVPHPDDPSLVLSLLGGGVFAAASVAMALVGMWTARRQWEVDLDEPVVVDGKS